MPKISELTSISALTSDDYLVITNDPGGTPATRIVTAKNALASTFGNYIDARDYGVTADGVTDDASAIVAAMSAAAEAGHLLILPSGTISVATPVFVDMSRGEHLRVTARGDTLISLNNVGLNIRGAAAATTTLAARAERHDIYIEVTDATGFVVGDIIRMWDPNVAVETGWNYDKACVRRIAAIDGTTIFLDEALEFFFDPSEASGVNVYTYEAARFSMEGVDVYSAAGTSSLNLSFLSEANLTDGTCYGRAPGWDPDFSDGMGISYSSDVTLDRFNFEKLRYAPNVVCARRVAIKNCYVKDIRHVDANSWTQDFLLENVTGISTDGIIQCHPCIRPVFRNVHDSVTNSSVFGFDMRGLGEVVENCSAVHNNYDPSVGVTTHGGNTNALLLRDDYKPMAAEFVRRIHRLRAPYTRIKLGNTDMIVTESHVGSIVASGYNIPTASAVIDEHTKARFSDDLLDTDNISTATITDSALVGDLMPKTVMRGRRARVPKRRQYRSVSSTATITNITKANPAVVTAPAHGFTTGDQIAISAVEGMFQINTLGNTGATITRIDDDSFSLDGINSTGYSDYVSGGLARYLEPIGSITAITQANPAVVTIAGHGLSNGDVVWINGVSGMIEINQGYYKVASATTDTFALTDLLDNNVNSSGYTAYSSGGKCTRQETVLTILARSSPMAGIADELRLQCSIVDEDTTGSESYLYPVKYDTFWAGSIDQSERYVKFRVKVKANDGYAEQERFVAYSVYNGTEVLEVQDPTNITFNNLSVDLKHFYRHERNRHNAEGVHPDSIAPNDTAGFRYALFFEVEVTATNSSQVIDEIIIEADEVRNIQSL